MGSFGSSFNAAFSNTVNALDAKKRRALEEAMSEFEKNLKVQQEAEKKRQFDTTRGDRTREFDTTRGDRKNEFGQTMGYRNRALDQDESQFSRRLDQGDRQHRDGMTFRVNRHIEDLQRQLDEAMQGNNATFRRDFGDGREVTYKGRYDPADEPAPPERLDPVQQAMVAQLQNRIAKSQQDEIGKRGDVGSFNARDLVKWLPFVDSDEEKAERLRSEREAMEAEMAQLMGQATRPPSPPRGGTPRALSTQDREALEWAQANPDDPRSAAIIERLAQ